MVHFATVAAIAVVGAMTGAEAFTASPLAIKSQSKTFLPRYMAEEDNSPTVERGVSIDQDGKSNVWAIEPKMEVDTKSAEEKGSSALLAAGGFAAFAVAAGVILTNLPDPDQF
mmetsp:Transcript_1485/g.2222  ORF Transcript_1485/g.2222 Transcript_1485/m.2222 type:complete len:113 (-) Transcript_1485:319-657(-)|eukprot:CAMPEP_0195521416 /NCGR_PEP_ID=MMETSP0794_2-20130614/18626_1 /TAXON_ID=515487 /ORGANISM="Stephanopyxis turris, Strain CCMP 815" /LENGTH=112 /DNA_ID=CAMNT_0040650965 /DNA_START=150 /DNA_END=488 /DNA_ORIENTATION=+